MSDPITLVSGFGRCGSSLAMQMLAAGGMPVTGEYPIFEATCPVHVRGVDWWPSLAGKAVKVLYPHRMTPLDWMDCEYRAIWLDRDPGEQAKSFQKFAAAFLPVEIGGRMARRALIASYRADRPQCMAVLQRLCRGRVMAMRFERLLSHPRESAEAISQHLGGSLNVDSMAAAVRPRLAKCMGGFLEMDLMLESRVFPIML